MTRFRGNFWILRLETKTKVAIVRDLQIGTANVRDCDYEFESLEIITIVRSELDLVTFYRNFRDARNSTFEILHLERI